VNGCSTPRHRRCVVFTDDELDDMASHHIETPVHLAIGEFLDALRDLGVPPGDDPNWPFLLSAGERRSFTANTILRDPAWRKRDPDGALRLAPIDAERLGLSDGDTARLTTARATATVTVAVDDTMHPGHIAIPNGLGLDHLDDAGRVTTGVAPNEFTASGDRDPWAATPWQSVPARLERCPA
jgi:anaerobic selenocysteine-containing dehydrogenase